MCDCDYEQPAVYGLDQPRARKPHTCCECRGVIQPGEVYNRHHGIWDGSASTFKICVDCEAMLNGLDGECAPAFGYLWEDIDEGGDPEEKARFEAIKLKRRPVPVLVTPVKEEE